MRRLLLLAEAVPHPARLMARKAYRRQALKWHPDKQDAANRAYAEEIPTAWEHRCCMTRHDQLHNMGTKTKWSRVVLRSGSSSSQKPIKF